MQLVVRVHRAQSHGGVGGAAALELVVHCSPCTLLVLPESQSVVDIRSVHRRLEEGE